MTGLPVGRCPNCGAAVSYFAWSCPNCQRRNLPNPVASTAVVVAVLVAGGLVVLGWQSLRGDEAPEPQAQVDGSLSTRGERGHVRLTVPSYELRVNSYQLQLAN